MAPTGPITGRVLCIDGDGLAYYCAGNDETPSSVAKERVREFVRSAKSSAGAESVVVLVTSDGSHKGHRYAVARVKAYQGKRVNKSKPKNWKFLRNLIEGGHIQNAEVEATDTAEADDRFGARLGQHGVMNTVICTQDKDMRMLPGWHMNWLTKELLFVPDGTYDLVHWEKQFGTKWFWLQMLHGDSVDFIPGLPKFMENGKLSLIGEVTAGKKLAGTTDDVEAYEVVSKLYESYYGEDWPVQMLEQAVLLWMRRDPASHPLDCTTPWGPMPLILDHPQAIAEIHRRIQEAQIVQAQVQ